jgi:hypothetical protein
LLFRVSLVSNLHGYFYIFMTIRTPACLSLI